MTLHRQLFIFTGILISILFIGVWVEKLHSTRSFLTLQLESHAQDTATSLGLSLSPIMAENDLPTVDTMINAVFDRGYYKIISLRDTEGKVITERILNVEIAGVPNWFINFISLDSPSADALVMANWNQAGVLYVESHPGLAYRTIWETMIRISVYFLLAGSAILILGSRGLHLLLKPLKRVELQAEAICRREYQIQTTLPKTRELRHVVESMNRMTSQVRNMFARQAKVAERLRQKAYCDDLTGLGNRRYFNSQVEAQLETTEEDVQGALLMLQINNLKEVNDAGGFKAGDDLLKKVGNILQDETKILKNVALARLTGGDFAIFMSQINSNDVNEIAEKLITNVNKLALENTCYSSNLAHLGGASYEQHLTRSKLLAEADNALQSARQGGPTKWLVKQISEDEDSAIRGKLWWRETLDKVLKSGEIVLYHQPVISSCAQETIVHHELLSRIILDSGKIISAGIFVPLAERLELISKLDKVILSRVFEEQAFLTTMQTIAVNVSPSSISDPSFVQWVLSKLKELPDNGVHIIFEFPEFGAVQHLDIVKEFSNNVQNLGHSIGLDHFGQSFSNFGYLKSLRPKYVKIDRGFTKELETDHGDSGFFIEALAGVAHSLDILVIAEGVEHEEQKKIFIEMNIDALQGYFFAKPLPLTS
ncbi:MAG: GGDEF-domain containing protein [Desulfotalea sp.]|nr:MAG: GGDEF-domain containing protein [Desulfotalea sp.]